MRTLHRLRRFLEGKWFLAEDEFTILELDQGPFVCPRVSVHKRGTIQI